MLKAIFGSTSNMETLYKGFFDGGCREKGILLHSLSLFLARIRLIDRSPSLLTAWIIWFDRFESVRPSAVYR